MERAAEAALERLVAAAAGEGGEGSGGGEGGESHEGSGGHAVPAAAGALDPPAYKRAVAERLRRSEKLSAARARLAAGPMDGGIADGSNDGIVGGDGADAEDWRIERALRQGVDEGALLCGWYDAAPKRDEQAWEAQASSAEPWAESPLGNADVPEQRLPLFLRSEEEVAAVKARLRAEEAEDSQDPG